MLERTISAANFPLPQHQRKTDADYGGSHRGQRRALAQRHGQPQFPDMLWWVKGRMINAGITKKPIATMADKQKINQIDRRAEFDDGIAMF